MLEVSRPFSSTYVAGQRCPAVTPGPFARPNAQTPPSFFRRFVDRAFPSHNLSSTTPRNTTRSIATASCSLRALRQHKRLSLETI